MKGQSLGQTNGSSWTPNTDEIMNWRENWATISWFGLQLGWINGSPFRAYVFECNDVLWNPMQICRKIVLVTTYEWVLIPEKTFNVVYSVMQAEVYDLVSHVNALAWLTISIMVGVSGYRSGNTCCIRANIPYDCKIQNVLDEWLFCSSIHPSQHKW